MQVRRYVEDRQEVGDHLVRLQNYTDTFLPIALRFVSVNIETKSLQNRLFFSFLVNFNDNYY